MRTCRNCLVSVQCTVRPPNPKQDHAARCAGTRELPRCVTWRNTCVLGVVSLADAQLRAHRPRRRRHDHILQNDRSRATSHATNA